MRSVRRLGGESALAGAPRLGSLAAAPSHDGDRNQGQRAAEDVGQPVASIHAAAAWGHQLVGLIKEPNHRGERGQQPPFSGPATGGQQPRAHQRAAQEKEASVLEFVEPVEWHAAEPVAGDGRKNAEQHKPSDPCADPECGLSQPLPPLAGVGGVGAGGGRGWRGGRGRIAHAP